MPKFEPRIYTADEQARFRAISFGERVRLMEQDRQEWWERLKADPVAYDEFIRRNFKKRAIATPDNGDWENFVPPEASFPPDQPPPPPGRPFIRKK